MNRVLLILTLLVAQAIPVTAESRDQDLDRWMEKDVIPHIREQLLHHPRFKGQTVMFVVLDDNVPAPVTNALALSLRDQLLDAAIRTPGVAVAWQQGRRPATTGNGVLDCERDAVHYYIGVELQQELDTSYSVKVRALDLEDRSWVAGFGRNWRGELRTIQRQAFRQSRADMTFRGSREVPFTAEESDLLARQLAHQLSCSVFRGSSSRYVIATDEGTEGADALSSAVELAGQNLVSHGAADLPARRDEHNAVLRGKAHPIDGGLYEYWLTVTPVGDDSGLSSLSTSAYLRLPHPPSAGRTGPFDSTGADGLTDDRVIGNADVTSRFFSAPAGSRLLSPLRISKAVSPTACDRGTPNLGLTRRASTCSLLETSPETDAIVFVVAHQARHGLVRLGGTACRERTAPRVATAGTSIRIPLPGILTDWRVEEASAWRTASDVDVYYALATTDARAARAIANHIDRLPLKCDDRLRPGLEGEELAAWMDGLAELAVRDHGNVDWRGLEVRDVM